MAALCRSSEGVAAKNVVFECTDEAARARSSFPCYHPPTLALNWFKDQNTFILGNSSLLIQSTYCHIPIKQRHLELAHQKHATHRWRPNSGRIPKLRECRRE